MQVLLVTTRTGTKKARTGHIHQARQGLADFAPQVRTRNFRLGRGVDLALEFVGRPETVELTLRCLDTGGRAVLVGVGPGRPALPPLLGFVGREQAVLGSFGMDKRDIADLLQLVARGRLDLSRSVTQVFPLAGVNDALGLLAKKDTGIVRLVVEPGR